MKYINWKCPLCKYYPNKWNFLEGFVIITCENKGCKASFYIEDITLGLCHIHGSGLVAKAQPDVLS